MSLFRPLAVALVGTALVGAGCGPCPQIAEGYASTLREELALVGAGGVDLAHPSHLRIDIGETAWERLVASSLPDLTLTDQRMRRELPEDTRTVIVTDTMATVAHAWPVADPSTGYEIALVLDLSLRVRRDAPGAEEDSVYFLVGEAEIWGHLGPDPDDPRRLTLDLSEPHVTGVVLDEGLLPEDIGRLVRPDVQGELERAALTLPARTEILWVPELDLGYRTVETAVTSVSVRPESSSIVLFLSTGLRDITPLRTAPTAPEPDEVTVSWSPSLIASATRNLLASGVLPRRYRQGEVDAEGPTSVTIERAWSDDGAIWVRFDLWRADTLECYRASATASSTLTVVDGDVQQQSRLGDPVPSAGEIPEGWSEQWRDGAFVVSLFSVMESVVDYDPLRLHPEVRSETSDVTVGDREVRVLRRVGQARGAAP